MFVLFRLSMVKVFIRRQNLSKLLAAKGNENKVITEEREEWVYQVLVALGISEDVIIELSNQELVSHLKTANIEVIDNFEKNSIEIFKKSKLVAEWKEPKLILKRENNKYHYEIHTDAWALPFQKTKNK